MAAQKLGWETLNALVLEVTPAQAILAALMDNQGEDMHWLDWYLAIELTAASDPNLTQKAIAESIEVTESYVSQALKVLKLLNQSSRDQILQQLKISDPFDLPERCILQLVGFGDGSTSSPQALALVERALKVVLAQRMKEGQVKKLVKWVKAGHNPEDFAPESSSKGDATDPEDPNARYWKPLPKGVKVAKSKSGYRVTFELALSEAVPVVYGAMANWEHLKGLAGELRTPNSGMP